MRTSLQFPRQLIRLRGPKILLVPEKRGTADRPLARELAEFSLVTRVADVFLAKNVRGTESFFASEVFHGLGGRRRLRPPPAVRVVAHAREHVAEAVTGRLF